jgi:DUF3102 family protein
MNIEQSPLLASSVLVEHAAAIRALGKQTVENVIEIGRRLVDCRDNHLDHGEWLPWLKREFGWSRQTADNFIHVYERADKLPNFGNLNLPVSSLYLLAAPGTPQAARDEVGERMEAGEELSTAEVKEIIQEHKPAEASADDTADPAVEDRDTEHEFEPAKPARHLTPTKQLREELVKNVRLTSELAAARAHIEELEAARQHDLNLADERLCAAENRITELEAENAALREKLAAALAERGSTDTVPIATSKAPIPPSEAGLTADPKKGGIPLFLQVQNRTSVISRRQDMPLTGKAALRTIAAPMPSADGLAELDAIDAEIRKIQIKNLSRQPACEFKKLDKLRAKRTQLQKQLGLYKPSFEGDGADSAIHKSKMPADLRREVTA